MKKLIYLLAVPLLIMGSCRKYVEVTQIGTRTLTLTSDYRAVLDNNSVMENGYGMPIYSCDDTRFLDTTKQKKLTDIYQHAYSWQAPYLTETQGDVDWETLYKSIYVCNQVTDGVLTSQGTDEQLKKTVYAEALVHRAYFYWCLVNMYAKQYDASTAATDLGVPLLLTPDLFASLHRASVATVYAQIITDLQAAAPDLPDLPDYKTRPSQAAVYALLARTYLCEGDYAHASTYAGQALQLQSSLANLNTYVNNTSAIPRRLQDPEIIFSKVQSGTNYQGIQLDTALLSLLGNNDLRYVLFVKPGGSFSPSFNGYGYWRYRYTSEGIYQGPSVPEMMLIKAECAARTNDAATAIGTLNTLRQQRFAPADYTSLPVGTPTAALNAVIQERRRELFGTGMRWFDQKRYNKESALAETVTRNFLGTDYTLAPNSNQYVYPIGTKYTLLNPELEQNPY
ncbi:SusD family protein [Chitinophaga costaii]|uniref:SusD family protein n=1 Tax=Chitinophaga costaii TaxID=1335309 RepID=A0A1C4EM91_9BACT|nr:RagB/SusD family nutrient uptake outer membrane protein [Chitinophaga costaii]PUZ22437.1 RagB/SusD family nutrient uptake outer membrane protein [Chitinophaga costaii]SCC44610.1 SusD family protein [Chitinophaga costaii]